MKKISFALLLLSGSSMMAQIQRPTAVTKQMQETKQTTTLQKIIPPAYDFSNLEFCVDRLPQYNNLPARDFSAVAPPPKINGDGSISNIGITRQPLAGETNKMWDPGQTISVYLNTNNGSETIRNRVKQVVKEWEAIANIKFAFVNDFKSAKIKVGFVKTEKNWSWIGKDVLFNPLGLYTMQLGSLAENIDDVSLRRIVLHEFGHALGFIHEHQSPASGIQWDKEKVYAFFAEAPRNFSRAETDINVLNKYASTNTNYSEYDRWSIMHYRIPPELTLDGKGTESNTSFSYTDIQYARQLYPFPITAPPTTGTLRTGDDCDLIDFKVEYNVAPADRVEFIFELGEMSGKKVTWWKQIVIPLTDNRQMPLWVQDHSLIPAENRRVATVSLPVAELNVNAPIAFWKAKMLGVHTLLPFKWTVLRALKGGCRIRLTWKDDSCS